MIALQFIFWTCLFLMFYSYILFPLIIFLLAKKKRIAAEEYSLEELPMISVLIAAYNEEKVIAKKIRSVLQAEYPAEKLEILVGSDASSDNTDSILQGLKKEAPFLRLYFFKERKGKPGIINHLAEEAGGEVLVISDANVILDKSTLFELIRYFRDDRIGLVDSKMINTGLKNSGISQQEKFYINREVNIKHHESVIWGTMMGPFGGCYAVKKALYKPVPDHFLVDDFFINMAVLEQNYNCISNLDAKVYEDVSSIPREEFRRKKRISAGNFQNLARYKSMLIRGRKGVGFCFFSHKVIRWIVPFLAIFSLASSVILGLHTILYQVLAGLHILVLIIPVIDHILRKIKIQSITLRFISHFVLMNLALLAGFFRYTGGIRTNVWQPTSRNQDSAQLY